MRAVLALFGLGTDGSANVGGTIIHRVNAPERKWQVTTGCDGRRLAHQEANDIRGAYPHAGEFWQERRGDDAWWADEFDRLREHGRIIKMSA